MTPDELQARFAALEVLRRGHFRLSSGRHSDTYLQCALALQRPDLALALGRALAARTAHLRPDVVASPALGGVLAGFAVAAALDRRFVFAERGADRVMTVRRGQRLAPGERVLVVEDVVTTGASAGEVSALCEAAGAEVVGLAALVDRSVVTPPPMALLRVQAATWEPGACPLCADGVPVDSPGSRHAAAPRAPRAPRGPR